MASSRALQFELDKVTTEYNECFNGLQELVKEEAEWAKGLKKLVGRMLTSRVLCEAAGGYLEKDGYINRFGDMESPLARMGFLCFFIGHELLDDGDPGLGWHKLNDDLQYDACSETEEDAKPFFYARKEFSPYKLKLLDVDSVIWVLDWHERYEDSFLQAVNEFRGTNEVRKPPDPMLVELALELGCEEQDANP